MLLSCLARGRTCRLGKADCLIPQVLWRSRYSLNDVFDQSGHKQGKHRPGHNCMDNYAKRLFTFDPVLKDLHEKIGEWQIYRVNKALPFSNWLDHQDPGWLLKCSDQTALGNRSIVPWKQEASTGRQRVQQSHQWKPPSSTAWQYLWAKPQCHQLLPRISKVKKTMRRSEMLINNRCKHQLLCLDRSGSQVRLFTSPQGPLVTPTLQSSPGTPAIELQWLWLLIFT